MKTTLTIAAMALAIVTGTALPLESAFAHGNDRDKPNTLQWKGNKPNSKHWNDHDRNHRNEWRSHNDHHHHDGHYCKDHRHWKHGHHYFKNGKWWCNSPRCYAPYPQPIWNGLRIDGTFIFD